MPIDIDLIAQFITRELAWRTAVLSRNPLLFVAGRIGRSGLGPSEAPAQSTMLSDCWGLRGGVHISFPLSNASIMYYNSRDLLITEKEARKIANRDSPSQWGSQCTLVLRTKLGCRNEREWPTSATTTDAAI